MRPISVQGEGRGADDHQRISDPLRVGGGVRDAQGTPGRAGALGAAIEDRHARGVCAPPTTRTPGGWAAAGPLYPCGYSTPPSPLPRLCPARLPETAPRRLGLQTEKADLEKKLQEQILRCEQIEKREQERREADAKKANEDKEYFASRLSQLKQQLETFTSTKK